MSNTGTRKKLKPLTQAESNYINKYEDNMKRLHIISSSNPKPIVRKSKKQLQREADDIKAKSDIERQF